MSVTDASRIISDGALIEIDGDIGTVTILSTEDEGLAALEAVRRKREHGRHKSAAISCGFPQQSVSCPVIGDSRNPVRSSSWESRT